MGACATKPKVDAGNAPAPEAALATENKAEEKNVVADAVVAVEAEKKLEVPPEEVAGEGNQSDKAKEVVVVDEDKVDDLSFKRRSLSNLFKEKEGGESIEFEGLAEETVSLDSKEMEKDTKEAEIKVPQTEVETEKCIEPETEAPQTIVVTEKSIEEPESKAPPTVVETVKHIEEAEMKVPQTEVETEKCTEEPETKVPQTEVVTEECIEPETKAPQTVVETEKCIEEPESKASQTVVETEKHIEEVEIKVPQAIIEPEKHTEEAEPKAPPTEVDTEKSEVPAVKIAIPDVPTTSETILEEKVTVTSPSDVAPTSVTPEEEKSEDVKLPEKVKKPETVTLVEEISPKDEGKTSEQKEEDISDVGKTEIETPKVTELKPTTETSTEPAQKHDEVKVTSEEKITS